MNIKSSNLWYPAYVYQFFSFPYNYKNRVLACFQTRPAIATFFKDVSPLLPFFLTFVAIAIIFLNMCR